jgi:FkbM family methyltransferase
MSSRQIKSGVKHLFRKLGLDVKRMDESTVPDERRFLWLTRLPIRTVLDIGANIGQSAIFYHGLFPYAHIYSFEPIEHCYAELKRNVADINVATAFNLALGDTQGVTALYRSGSAGSSSLLPMGDLHYRAFPSTKPSGEEQVRVARLDDWAGDRILENDILMKIDVQGYEDRVLAGGQSVLERTRLIITEVSFQELYRGQTLFQDIYRQLEDAGFRYMGSIKQMLSPLDGGVLQADAVFLRTE